tara:strand:+ start:435 stop:992 length:558 start_codon:yes stop_codon:yes gene_type:complete
MKYFKLEIIPQETERTRFTKLDESIINSFHEYSLQKEIYEHLEFEPFTTKKESLEYIEKLTKRIENGCADYRLINLKGSNEIVGLFGFHSYDNYRKSIEFGFGVSPKYQRKGFFKEISNHMIYSLFKNTDLHRIFAFTSINNNASIKGLESLGFTREGKIRDYYFKNGEYFDAVFYNKIRKENSY